MKKIIGIYGRRNLFNVQWQLGNFCNYDCSYCNPHCKDGTSPPPVIETCKRVVDNFIKQLPDRNVQFNFVGGEPTTYKAFPELIDYIDSSGGYVAVVSNGSRSPAYFKSIAPKLSAVYLTFHHERANLQKFCEVLKVFDPRYLWVYITMNPAAWAACQAAVEAVTALGCRAIPKLLYSDYGSRGANKIFPYTAEQRKFIDDGNRNLLIPKVPTDREVVTPTLRAIKGSVDHLRNTRLVETIVDGVVTTKTSQEMVLAKENLYSGYKCWGGLEQMVIDSFGNVCSTVCAQEGVLANIFKTPEFALPTAPLTCKTAACWCETDLLLTKEG